MGNSRDQIVRDTIAAGSTVQYASTAGSRLGVASGMTLNLAEIREAVRTLKNNNVKPLRDGRYVGIISPNTASDLRADTTVLSAWNGAAPRSNDNPFFSGVVGDLEGVTFVETSNAKTFASLGQSGANIEATLIIGRGAYVVTELASENARTYVKPRGSAGTKDPIDLISTIGYKTALACGRVDETAMVRIEHLSTAHQGA